MVNSAAIRLYDAAWRLATPLLRANARLKDGYDQRRLKERLPAADLWIQAASGGEAYLAETLIRQLAPDGPMRILVTTNTRQGMEILHKTVVGKTGNGEVLAAYFPFDRPTLMDEAVAQVRPRLVVLLETEIWPGLLHALKTRNCPVFIVNARMRQNSLARYRRFTETLYALRPDAILAISAEDASRFAAIFGNDIVSVMPNIKFDRIAFSAKPAAETETPLVSPDHAFLVLGSVRQEEEADVREMIIKIRRHCPDTVIGVFPRHMHRLGHWQVILDQIKPDWRLRSEMQAPAAAGDIILWDTFGELSKAYASAAAVFVGGSLAPLGGQNFLEPLTYGIVPVIGPFWDNFTWVGETVFEHGLVEKVNNWQQAADRLIRHLQTPPDSGKHREAARRYIRNRQGGTEQACRLIRPRLRPVSESMQTKD